MNDPVFVLAFLIEIRKLSFVFWAKNQKLKLVWILAVHLYKFQYVCIYKLSRPVTVILLCCSLYNAALQKLDLVNGVLFTGGSAKSGLYYDVAERIFKVI